MKKLNQIFSTHRAIYNKVVDISKDDCYQLTKKQLADKYRGVSQKHSLTNYLPDYHLNVPEEVMNSTYRDYEKALVSSKALFFSLKEKDSKTTFPELSFKSRRDNTSSIEIASRSIKVSDTNQVRFFPKYFGFKKDEGFDIKEQFPKTDYAVRLLRTRSQKYYLCIPRCTTKDPVIGNSVCAIDPGVRDFITMYDPTGLVLGVKDKKEAIFRRCLLIDKINRLLTTEENKRKRSRMRVMRYNLFQRVKRMIKDMHHKVSSWLADNYKYVLLPVFNTSQMTKKQQRISSKTSRKMMTWSHYQFKELLRYKMSRRSGLLIDCTEEYSSKCCTKCGNIKKNLGAAKLYFCKKCKLTSDRDVNAARNIYMMNEFRIPSAVLGPSVADALC